eukprot:1467626-Prymnesium_polylepis.1
MHSARGAIGRAESRLVLTGDIRDGFAKVLDSVHARGFATDLRKFATHSQRIRGFGTHGFARIRDGFAK